MTITATTTQAVKFHGWTLPAGSSVVLSGITRDGYAGCSTVTATTDAVSWNIALPTWAIDVNVWASGLPITNL